MTSADFDAAIRRAGLTGTEAARRLRVSEGTVSAWRTGARPIPRERAGVVRNALRIAADEAMVLDLAVRIGLARLRRLHDLHD